MIYEVDRVLDLVNDTMSHSPMRSPCCSKPVVLKTHPLSEQTVMGPSLWFACSHCGAACEPIPA